MKAGDTQANVRDVWIHRAEVKRILGVSEFCLRKLLERNLIATHQLPGMRRRHYRPDVERLAPKPPVRDDAANTSS